MRTPILAGCLCGMLVLVSASARAEPGIGDIKRSRHPLVVEARKYDFYIVGTKGADQAKAEENYLGFIRANPDHPLVPFIYYQLGHMYSDGASSTWKRYGIHKDEKKAAQFFRAAIDNHPPDKVSHVRVKAWVSAAASASTERKRVEMYVELYKYLQRLKKEDILEMYLYSDADRKELAQFPENGKLFEQRLWTLRTGMMDVVEGNVIAIASDSAKEPLELLDYISSSVPGTHLAKFAEERKAKMIAENPLLSKE